MYRIMDFYSCVDVIVRETIYARLRKFGKLQGRVQSRRKEGGGDGDDEDILRTHITVYDRA